MDDKEKLWYKVARVVVKSGIMPIFPVNEPLLTLLKTLLTEEEAEFLLIFNRKSSLNINELKDKTNLGEESLNRMLDVLQKKGIIVGSTSRSTGLKIFRLMGPFPGIFEYQYLAGGTGEKEKKIAVIFERLFKETIDAVQENYDDVVPKFKDISIPVDRVVPVEELVEVPEETILPYYEVSKIIDDYEDIALAHCYCRHEKDLAGDPCKISDDRLNCFMFSKSAQFAIEYGFAKPVSKEEAKKIIKKAEDDGFVHKAFHVHSDPNRELEALCNCCSCCCGIFRLYNQGAIPLHTVTTYRANVDKDLCSGCGTCVEKCPMETIELEDDIALINPDNCIGCGVCAHHCPEEAIDLEKTEQRKVYVLPPRLKV